MKKNLFAGALAAMALLVAFVSVAAFSVGDLKRAPTVPVYEENEKGLSFGYVNPELPPDQQAYPQLIAAIGIDGTHGYVYADDLNGNMPKNPEEALRYMEQLDAEAARARAAGARFIRTIPLYMEDGETIIGEFGISYG